MLDVNVWALIEQARRDLFQGSFLLAYQSGTVQVSRLPGPGDRRGLLVREQCRHSHQAGDAQVWPYSTQCCLIACTVRAWALHLAAIDLQMLVALPVRTSVGLTDDGGLPMLAGCIWICIAGSSCRTCM